MKKLILLAFIAVLMATTACKTAVKKPTPPSPETTRSLKTDTHVVYCDLD